MAQERRLGPASLLGQVDPGVRYLVVGGLAASRYMPERSTRDTDVLVGEGDAERFYAWLTTAGATRLGPLAIGGSSWRLPDGGELDVIVGVAPWVDKALAHGEMVGGFRYATLPYLVLMKLEAGRMTDLGDLARMLGLADAKARQAVRAAVRRFRPTDLEDVDSLIRLGELETGE